MTDLAHLNLMAVPKGKPSHLLVAFRGWPDANEASTWAMRCLLKKLSAKKMAELDPEEFFDFEHVRPHIRFDAEGTRKLIWPSNEIFCHDSSDPSKSFMLLLATEPSLKWRTYCDVILDLAITSGVHTIVHIGALLDSIPHTRPLKITGSSTDPLGQNALAKLSISSSRYQGPSSISSAMMERSKIKGLRFLTMWGHSPHYIQTTPNLKVTHGLVQAVCELLHIKIDLKDLGDAAGKFENELRKIIDKNPRLLAYVQKLEQQYDRDAISQMGMPDGKQMVLEVEQFLKDQRGPDQIC